MAWVLTWFAHDLKDINTVSRLYDVLLGAHPTLILYICAAVRKNDKDAPDTLIKDESALVQYYLGSALGQAHMRECTSCLRDEDCGVARRRYVRANGQNIDGFSYRRVNEEPETHTPTRETYKSGCRGFFSGQTFVWSHKLIAFRSVGLNYRV